MPIYEYECRKCKAHTEVMQKITDKPLTKCRKCGGRLEKQWSSTSFQLKGSGWYVTDYSAKKSEAKEETKSAATETKSETTPEAKPAEKSKATETPAATKSSKTKTSSSKTATSSD
ncbi:MAG: FmdB family zinc ribbon protein [Pyrinomonadaceae bacterium]